MTEQESHARIRALEAVLAERKKELKCVHAFSKIVDRSRDLNEILQGLVELIPPSWQYPGETTASLTLRDRTFSTPNHAATEWMQSAPICVHGREIGTLTVAYTAAKPERDEGPFLQEERDLLDTLTERLGKIVERLEAQERMEDMNTILRSIRRIVNKANISKTYSRQLMQEACDILVNARGYRTVWIAT